MSNEIAGLQAIPLLAEPAWYQFSARTKWKQAVADYETNWFRSLSDEDIENIFEIFVSSFSELEAKAFPYPGLAIRTINSITATLCDMEAIMLRRSNNLSDSSSRRLYHLLSTGFFTMKNEAVGKGLVLSSTEEFSEWSKSVHSCLHDEITGVQNLSQIFTPGFKASTAKLAYDYVEDISKLPTTIREPILELKKSVEDKNDWNLDGQTRHSIDRILVEYVPAMVKSYVDLKNAGDKKNIISITKSIQTQVDLLQKFVDQIESRMVHESVYTMKVQEEFISTKFNQNAFS